MTQPSPGHLLLDTLQPMSRYEFVPPSERPHPKVPSDPLETRRLPPVTREERYEKSYPHRRRLTRWLCEGFEPQTARCCLIGPGCGAQVILQDLLTHFSHVCLIDIEQQNLERIFEDQPVDQERLQTEVLHDFAGITSALEHLRERAREEELKFHDVQEGIEAAQNLAAWPVPSDFDIVLSTEGLGMVLSAAAAIVGHQHPSLPDFHHAIRTAHIRALLKTLKPQGYGMVVNQLTNSKVMPSLPKVPPDKLELVLSEVVQKGLAPIGVSPIQLRDMLLHDQGIKNDLSQVHMLAPWIFDTGTLQFAMSGVSFRKAAAANPDPSD